MATPRYEIIEDDEKQAEPQKANGSRYSIVEEDKQQENKNPSFFDTEAKIKNIVKSLNKRGNPITFEEANHLFGTETPSSRIARDIVSGAANILPTIGKGLSSAASQGIDDPWRLAKNTFAGAAGLPFNLANQLMNIPAYIEKINRQKRESKLEQYTPQFPVEKAQKWLVGGEEKPEDVEIRQGIGALPMVLPFLKYGKGVAGEAVGKVIGKKNPLLEAEKIKKELEIGSTEKELGETTVQHETQKDVFNKTVSEAKKNVNMSDADKMEYKVNEQDKKLGELREQHDALTEKLDSLEVPSEKPTMGKKSAERVKETENKLNQYKSNLSDIQNHHEKVSDMANEADKSLDKYLNKEGSHAVEIGHQITHRVKSIENYWKNRYQGFVEKVKDVNFQMPENAMSQLNYSNISPTELIKTYGANAFDAIKKGKMEEFIQKQQKKELPENPYYKKLLDIAPTIKDTSAADFLLKRKAFRDELFDLNRKINRDKFNTLDEEKARQAVTKGFDMMQQIESTLETGLGDFLPEFKEINAGYAEQVHPLRDNPVVQKAEDGHLTDNVLKELRTNDPGMQLVRDFVNQDPQLRRNVIGQRYVHKPDELYHPNAEMRQYLNTDPTLQKMVDNRKEAHRLTDTSKTQIINAKRKLSDAEKLSKEAIKTHKAESAQFNKELVKFNKETNQHFKTREELQNNIKNTQKQISDMEEKQTKLTEHMENVRKEFDKKNITLKQKNELGLKLKELKKQKSELDKKILVTKGYVRRGLHLAKMVYRATKKLTGGI